MNSEWKNGAGAGVPVVRLVAGGCSKGSVGRLGAGGGDGGGGGAGGLSKESVGRVGARYELDEAALRRVLLREDVLNLPAVVLSVAGAFRGGKSFILDFFLRYLTAPRASQLSGEWLGKEDEPLKGFHWRSGCERDTTGIHLWPEPIVTTLDSGEKVAVLLMDTQGTFDSESTVEQNCTIFALSTLISSVQIYNLFRNIQENDLQHLQLFTEYGKLASEAKGKAFQTLLFLVRDWMSCREHAYGFDGGAALLSKRLQSKPNQNAELREVRQHINSSFERIKCFLMPHPGLSVAEESFSGCIRDLTKDFRSKLLELVPSLFDPGHLTPKLINGERVMTQDLYEYFKKYVEIFNSDEVPEATTIFRATADACLLVAARAACGVYAARMDERVLGARSLATRALHAAHENARAHAERAFAKKRKLGSQEEADARLADLLKELDGRLSRYILANEAKVRETVSLAKRTYDAAVSSVCGEHARLCLHPRALEKLHDEASLAALTLFDAARDVPEHDEDDQRPKLEQILKQAYDHLLVSNHQNNKSAMQDARELYVKRMKTELDADAGGVRVDKLRAQHQRALDNARAFLEQQRNGPSDHDDDPYLDQLLQELDGVLSQYILENKEKVQEMMSLAKKTYGEVVSNVCGDHTRMCLHPRALRALDYDARLAALRQFYAGRDVPEHDEDVQRLELEQGLRQMYEYLHVINDQNNKRAVLAAHELYMTRMRTKLDAACGSISTGEMKSQHQLALYEARAFLEQQRNCPSTHDDDPYLDLLLQKIEDCFKAFARAIKKNKSKKKASMQAAENTYNNHITSEWGPQMCCFHPQALKDLHKEAVKATLKDCLAARQEDEEDDDDDEYTEEVTKTLERRFLELVSVNEFNNERAVEEAVNLYTMKMTLQTTEPQPTSLGDGLVIAFKSILHNVGLVTQNNVPQTECNHHKKCKHDAVKVFKKKRRGAEYPDDKYYDDLIKKIDAAYSNQ